MVIKVITFFLVAAIGTSAQPGASSLPRVAVFDLESHKVPPVEIRIFSNIFRSCIVRSGRFTVLDRDNVDKIMSEKSLAGMGITDDNDAVRVGRLLNVDMIVTGTLMLVDADYFYDLRLIDARTSSIYKSRTGTCAANRGFNQVLHMVAEEFCDTVIAPLALSAGPLESDASLEVAAPERPDTDAVYYQIQSSDGTLAGSTMTRFRMLGFTAQQYKHFARSGETTEAWAVSARKSPAGAALLGALPCASGFFYTGDYGVAVFLTLAKLAAVAGMIPYKEKGGESKDLRWLFPALWGTATAVDIAGSAWSAHRINVRLERLSSCTSGAFAPACAIALTF